MCVAFLNLQRSVDGIKELHLVVIVTYGMRFSGANSTSEHTQRQIALSFTAVHTSRRKVRLQFLFTCTRSTLHSCPDTNKKKKAFPSLMSHGFD